jgi:hypothetical protein
MFDDQRGFIKASQVDDGTGTEATILGLQGYQGSSFY